MKSSSSESSNPSAITKFSFVGSNSKFRRFSNTEFLEFSQIFWHFYDQFQFLFKSWFMTISKRWPWLMIGWMIIRKICLERKFEYSTCIIFWPWILCFAIIMHFHHENYHFCFVPIANFFLDWKGLWQVNQKSDSGQEWVIKWVIGWLSSWAVDPHSDLIHSSESRFWTIFNFKMGKDQQKTEKKAAIKQVDEIVEGLYFIFWVLF